jgi:hypothetical protein
LSKHKVEPVVIIEYRPDVEDVTSIPFRGAPSVREYIARDVVQRPTSWAAVLSEILAGVNEAVAILECVYGGQVAADRLAAVLKTAVVEVDGEDG